MDPGVIYFEFGPRCSWDVRQGHSDRCGCFAFGTFRAVVIEVSLGCRSIGFTVAFVTFSTRKPVFWTNYWAQKLAKTIYTCPTLPPKLPQQPPKTRGVLQRPVDPNEAFS